MRKNQKFSQEEMYLAVEKWQESGLSQSKFCKEERITFHIFKYWHKKFIKEKGQSKVAKKKSAKKFIPVKIEKTPNPFCKDKDFIEIIYPNGVQLSCPVSMDVQQIRTLINFQ